MAAPNRIQDTFAKATFQAHGDRAGTFMNASFEATLEVKGIDSIGGVNTITKTISEDFNVNIMRLLIEAKDGVFEGKIKMKVHDVEDIQKMCVTLSKIQNIKSVGRVAD